MTDKEIKTHKRASKVKKGKMYFKMILSLAYASLFIAMIWM